MKNHSNILWYISKFPESLYISSRQKNKEYGSRVIYGKDITSQSTVLICGLARNINDVLPYTIARIERLGRMFKSFNIYIYENDSDDSTLRSLYTWQDERSNVIVESEELGTETCTGVGHTRRIRMAYYRNQYVKYIKSLEELPDYVIILDMDILGGWSYEGIYNSFGWTEWDVMASNGLLYRVDDGKPGKVLYDTWALRFNTDDEHNPKHNLLEYNRGEDIFNVVSGFGGLAIYNSEIFSHNITYNDSDCDHVTLHKQICNLGYKIYINPSQIVVYNKHMYNIF